MRYGEGGGGRWGTGGGRGFVCNVAQRFTSLWGVGGGKGAVGLGFVCLQCG